MTRRQDSGSESTKGPPVATPALATTMSTLPKRSFTSCRDPGHRLVVGDVGVPVVALGVQPLARPASARPAPGRPARPSRRARRACGRAARPTPRAAPVTTATCPSRLRRCSCALLLQLVPPGRRTVVAYVATSSRIRAVTASGASTGVMCPSPAARCSPTQSAARRPAPRACTGGVSRSRRADDDGRRHRQLPYAVRRDRARRARAPRRTADPRGQACTIRAHASTCPAPNRGPSSRT